MIFDEVRKNGLNYDRKQIKSCEIKWKLGMKRADEQRRGRGTWLTDEAVLYLHMHWQLADSQILKIRPQ